MVGFIPGASPPEVRMPMVFVIKDAIRGRMEAFRYSRKRTK
jgi:hypothetical protein